LKALSLFSGAMGLDLGLEAAGIETLACCEIDKWCCATIRRNRPNIKIFEGSVSQLDPIAVAEIVGLDSSTLLVGGPPCQSFSSAGNRSGLNDPRGNLIFEFFRFVNALKPQAFIFENVGNILTAALKHRPIHMRPGKHWNLARYSREHMTGEDSNLNLEDDELSGSAFRYLLDELHSLHYSLTFGILNSADFGTPQKRIRFCMLGFRDVGASGLALPTHGEPPLIPYVTLRDAISDLLLSPGVHSMYTDPIAQIFGKVPPGGNWRNLPVEDQKAALGGAFEAGGGKSGFMRRLSWDTPAPTLTTKSNRKGTALCHPEYVRPLSVDEYKRIQGFPDYWQLVGAMNQQYQQIGNAVPAQLGKALGTKVLSTIVEARNKHELTKAELLSLSEFAVCKLRSYARNNKKKNSNQCNLFSDEYDQIHFA
jgi:DNA (cytosine-5)-methyltransferase 1